ncbi:MAG: Toxin-antitoxin biofilm protein TabA [Spirochaetes bacterium ADurb.Bin110]|jgi:YhcH/YjgK/YiaL family protein|nr:MAG: Toxin-antitoxin biofilm protein TabA [Spirochaetes bacterium ADurb.Bin110]OQB98557.1 MAG: Toxin-antitoxin biofilm protein TabA [Spirochaetes bacterium ADurb.Bin110]
MIVSMLSELSRYRGLSKNLDIAFDWLHKGLWRQLSTGKYSIEGDVVFALIQEYTAKEHSECRFESHREYIDIQMMISGKEIIEVLPVNALKVIEPYKPDIEFYALPTDRNANVLAMNAEQLAIFFPEDAHRPCMKAGALAESVRKVVVKVAI